MTDPLTLVFMALSAVTSTLLYVFRQWMVEKDKSYDRLEKDCETSIQDIKGDNKWLKEQLEEAQRNANGTLAVISKAVDTQGVGVKALETQGRAILEILQAAIQQRSTGTER